MLGLQLTLTEFTENGTAEKGDPLYSARYILNNNNNKNRQNEMYLKNNILLKPDILLRKCHKGLSIIDCFKCEGVIFAKIK